MKRLFFAVLFAATLLSACGDAGRGVATRISGRFVGSNVDTVYLERVSDNFTMPERIGAQACAPIRSGIVKLSDTRSRYTVSTLLPTNRPEIRVATPRPASPHALSNVAAKSTAKNNLFIIL